MEIEPEPIETASFTAPRLPIADIFPPDQESREISDVDSSTQEHHSFDMGTDMMDMDDGIGFDFADELYRQFVGAQPTPSPTTDNEQAQNVWSSLPEMITGRCSFGSATCNEKFYVFGGIGAEGKTDEAEMYDPAKNSWTPLPKMSSKRSDFSCAVVENEIYLFGGFVNAGRCPSNTVAIFNVTTKTWDDSFHPMPRKRQRHSSIAIGKKIYVFGGYRSDGKTDVLDTETGVWSEVSDMKTDRYSFAAVALGQNIYAIGGMIEKLTKNNNASFTYLETVEVFNTSTGTWTISNETMRNRRSGCCAVVLGSVITVLGGCDESSTIGAIESFDSIQDPKWRGSILPPINTERRDFCAMVRCADLIVIGGAGSVKDPLAPRSKQDDCLDSVETFGNAVRLALNASKSDVPIPESNTTSNLDYRQEEPIKTTNMKSSKVKTKQRIHEAKRTLRKRSKPSNNTNAKKQQQAQKKTKADPLLSRHSGCRVAKIFDEELYFGTVSPEDTDTVLFITVKYDDGDCEQLDAKELEDALELYDEEKRYDRRNNKKYTETAEKDISKKNLSEAAEKGKKAAAKKKGSVVTEKAKTAMGKRNASIVIEKSKTAVAKKKESVVTEKAKTVVAKKKESVVTEKAKKNMPAVAPVKQGPALLENRLQSIQQLLNERMQKVTEMEEMVFGTPQDGSLQGRILKLEESLGVSVSL